MSDHVLGLVLLSVGMDRTCPGAGDPARAAVAQTACLGADGRAGAVSRAVSRGRGSSALFLGCPARWCQNDVL